MSAADGIHLRLRIQRLVDDARPMLPLSATQEAGDERAQDRAYALVDALCYELADRFIEEMAGGYSSDYVADRLTSFINTMLVPFTLSAIKERREQKTPAGRC